MTSFLLRVCALGLLVASTSVVGCASKGAAASSGQVEDSANGLLDAASATLVVHGMSCPLCASNVDKQLLEVAGVSSAKVDMGTGEVKVTFAPNARVTRQQLEFAVFKSGFTLAEVRTP
jgi:copper chaperone CopZ